MAANPKPPEPAADSAYLAGLKQKLATRFEKQKELETRDEHPEHDLAASKARNAREIKDLEAAIKKETK